MTTAVVAEPRKIRFTFTEGELSSGNIPLGMRRWLWISLSDMRYSLWSDVEPIREEMVDRFMTWYIAVGWGKLRRHLRGHGVSALVIGRDRNTAKARELLGERCREYADDGGIQVGRYRYYERASANGWPVQLLEPIPQNRKALTCGPIDFKAMLCAGREAFVPYGLFRAVKADWARAMQSYESERLFHVKNTSTS